jgi:ligand-binding sensor domain-containing protein
VLDAQQPACFVLGEDQFKGVQIYDVIQNKELNYLFATNEGIFLFDYHTYERIGCDKAKGNSVFDFVMNEEGTIYCRNLNGQIFRIHNRKCILLYELKSNEVCADVSLAITDDGGLIIGGKKIVVLDKNGKIKDRYAYPKRYLAPAYTQNNSAVLFHMSGTDSVIRYSGNTFSKDKLHFGTDEYPKKMILTFYRIGSISYALDLESKSQYLFDENKFQLTAIAGNGAFSRNISTRVYETGDHLWVAGTLPGVVMLDNQTQWTDNRVFYEDYFISDVFKDKEGNVLLSTFDKGVLVIPDIGIPGVINPFRDDPVTSLFSDPSSDLMLGTSRGKLLNYRDGKLTRINNKEKKPIEAIYGSTNSDLILFDDGNICAYNKRTKEINELANSSLKDAVIVSGNEVYLGTNNGIIRVSGAGKMVTEHIKSMGQRIYSVEYDPQEKALYAAASNGLFRISAAGSVTSILHNKEEIFSTDLLWYDGKLFVCTNEEGILLVEKDRVTDSIKPVVNGRSEVLKKIRFYKNTIIAKSSNGLFQFDREGNMLKQFHSVFGFSSKRIIDFAIGHEKLWVSPSGGVQAIDPDYLQVNPSIPIIRMDEVTVNNEAKDLLKAGDFDSDQRKVRFVFSSPTLKNRETIRYKYKLAGYEKEWTIINYPGNEITYSALDAGNYVFMVLAENQGVVSRPVSYSFSISAPVYLRWWFIALLVFVFVAIVMLVYRRQLTIQRKKSEQINELNASKLTAIQSQMNPHFIFNSLNSVQDLILKGDVEHSYTYITTFSNLVRRTLNYSEKDFIDFDQEIKLLELYLSLEKLRFKKDLEYEISYKNVEDIMLPPLLVQPFIENALVHGLLHREGNKRLKITFDLKDVLICTVEDNGVGREKAKMIKQRQQAEHESFSGQAIRKRFEILSNVFGGEFGYMYEDLYENDLPTGTRVTLMIPVKRKF